MDKKMAQAGSKTKKQENILNNNGPRDQKEPFLTSKNGGKKEKNKTKIHLVSKAAKGRK